MKSPNTANCKTRCKIRPLHGQAASHGITGEIHSFDLFVGMRHFPLFFFPFFFFKLHPFIKFFFLYNQREACIVRNKWSDSDKNIRLSWRHLRHSEIGHWSLRNCYIKSRRRAVKWPQTSCLEVETTSSLWPYDVFRLAQHSFYGWAEIMNQMFTLGQGSKNRHVVTPGTITKPFRFLSDINRK